MPSAWRSVIAVEERPRVHASTRDRVDLRFRCAKRGLEKAARLEAFGVGTSGYSRLREDFRTHAHAQAEREAGDAATAVAKADHLRRAHPVAKNEGPFR